MMNKIWVGRYYPQLASIRFQKLRDLSVSIDSRKKQRHNNQKQKRQKDKMASRLKWTPQEEQHIKYLKEVAGLQSWKEIAEKLNQDIEGCYRSGKQCRQRYINYVRFGSGDHKSSDWTEEDDEKFTSLYFQHGAKWAYIVNFMPQKSENCLKNRFYGGLRRIIRKINRVEKIYKMRKSKPLRYETLLRVLDYKVSQNTSTSFTEEKVKDFETFLLKLKASLLQSTWDLLNKEVSDQTIVEIILNVHQFNARIRGLTFKQNQKFFKVRGELAKLKSKDEKNVETIASDCQESEKIQSMCEEEPEEEMMDCLSLSHPSTQEEMKADEEFILPEMTQFFPKIQYKPDGEKFDAEVDRILQIEHTPMSFCFFEQ